jgi:hypothetical protein
MNRTLVPVAAACSTAAATYAPWLLTRWSPECNKAIQQELPTEFMERACGPDFGSGDLLLMIFVGGVTLVVTSFWKDIAQFCYEKFTAEKH